jgi:hypothetical protein
LKISNFMKALVIIVMIILSISCAGKDESWKKQAIAAATSFAESKINSPRTITDSNGVVSIADTLVRYVIDPACVFRGKIDQLSSLEEIWVTIDSLHDPYLMPDYHLVLQKAGDSLHTLHVIHSDMRILQIKDGIITAEIPTHEPASPLYYCSECRDTVQYKLVNGKIVL